MVRNSARGPTPFGANISDIPSMTAGHGNGFSCRRCAAYGAITQNQPMQLKSSFGKIDYPVATVRRSASIGCDRGSKWNKVD
jgi:hypothetical protein